MPLYEERLTKDLARIRDEVAVLGTAVQQAQENAVQAALNGDKELANQTILRDHPINRKTREITRLCHGGPPCGEFTLANLVNIRSHKRLGQEIIWNRVRRPNRPGGFAKRHVEAFRTKLGVDQRTPFIVGHTPLSVDETLWLNAGRIQDHHIVYSANPHNLAIFIGADEGVAPVEYHSEPLLGLINTLKF